VSAVCFLIDLILTFVWLNLIQYSDVKQDYIHKVPVILYDNLQRESHEPYSPPT